MTGVTWQEIGVVVSVVASLLFALAMFRSTMKDLRVEIRDDIAGIRDAMNGIRDSIQHVADAAASKLELSQIATMVLEHDRKIIRAEARLDTLKDQIERMAEHGSSSV